MNVQFSPPDITEEEIQSVAEALRSGWITTGPRTKEFEREIAKYCKTKKAVLPEFGNRLSGDDTSDSRNRSGRRSDHDGIYVYRNV